MKTAIDLYCGCGGISVGAEMALPELKVVYGLDFDPHACKTFAQNHPDAVVDCRDVAEVTARSIIERTGIEQLDYMFAGPTCQAVSTMGIFYDADPRNELFVHFARLLKELQALGRKPKNIILENVPGVVYGKNVRIVSDLFDFLGSQGYRVYADVLNLASLGVPQLRYRFFLIATIEDRDVTLPHAKYFDPATEPSGPAYLTVDDAIGDLYDIPVGGGHTHAAYANAASSEYQNLLRRNSGGILNHWVSNTQPINLRRIASVPQGGSWKDIPEDLLPSRFHKVRMTDYSTLYGRLHQKNPAYTISASFANVTSGCFTHPLEDRALSVREGARLQGFPDTFEFLGPKNAQYRQVGNAVPPVGMMALLSHLESQSRGQAARISAEVLASGKRLPVLAPRFKGKLSKSSSASEGYGGATYWPKGWGPRPNELPRGEANYRKSTEDTRYRRRDEWRPKRDKVVGDFAQLSKSLIVPGNLPGHGVHTVRLADKSGLSNNTFLEAVAHLGAWFNEIESDVQLVLPFNHWADRARTLLNQGVKNGTFSFSVGSDDLMAKGRRRQRVVWVSTPKFSAPPVKLSVFFELDRENELTNALSLWGPLVIDKLSEPPQALVS